MYPGAPPQLSCTADALLMYRRCTADVQEAKIALARLYQRYSFRLAPGQVPLPLVNGITMSPRHGVKVVVLQRGQQEQRDSM